MKTFLSRVAVVSVLAVPVLGGLAAPANAATPSAAIAINGPATACPKPTSCPLSKIELSAGKAVYVPKALSGHLTVGKCTSTNYSVAVFNLTKVSQQITFQGKPAGLPIPGVSGGFAHGEVFCASTKGSGTFSLKSNAKALLKVTIS